MTTASPAVAASATRDVLVFAGWTPALSPSGSPINAPVYCRVKLAKGRLSITGTVRMSNGAGGQIVGLLESPEFIPAEGFDVAHFARVWRRWHLNDMRPGCEHQRAEGWDTRPIDPAKPLHTYGKHFEGQQASSWNMLSWVTRAEHPSGLLSEPCTTCGYKFGSGWLMEALPEDVVSYVQGLTGAPGPYEWA